MLQWNVWRTITPKIQSTLKSILLTFDLQDPPSKQNQLNLEGFVFTVIRKSEYTPETLEAFWKIFGWSCDSLMTGKTPCKDWDGNPISGGGQQQQQQQRDYVRSPGGLGISALRGNRINPPVLPTKKTQLFCSQCT